MNFSGISAQRPIGRLLRYPLRLIPRGTRLPILQGKLRGTRWIVAAGTHGCWLGSYEIEQRRLFEQSVAPGDTVYDIGAHAGFYTLLASVLVGPGGHVVAFEPLAENLVFLRQHLALNGIANVTIVEAAVTDQRGQVAFDPGADRSLGRIAADGARSVQAIRLDDLLAEGSIPAPDCMKIDVEGAELRVLEGARRVLERCRPRLFLATHSADLHRACCGVLGELGYRVRMISGSGTNGFGEVIAE